MTLLDGDVVEQVKEVGRDAVLAALLPEYRRKVFALAYGILRDIAAAEDVAQEVFVKVWRALPDYDGRARLSTWIYAITRNTAISALRQRRPMLSLSDEAAQAEAEVALAGRHDEGHDEGRDDGRSESRIDLAVLARHVDALPERQRQVVTLFYLQDRSHEEVAAMLAMPLGSVKNTLFRARAALQKALAGGARRGTGEGA